VLVLLAVMAWAVYVVFGKAYVGRYGVVTTTGLTVVIGTLLYVPLGLAVSREASFRAVSPVGWASVAYLVILTSVVAYLVYRRWRRDLFVLAGGVSSVVLVAATFLLEHMGLDDYGGFLLVALAVIGLSALGTRWLHAVAAETDE
jgi:drug/metabolite transporter (DMT)-like permease